MKKYIKLIVSIVFFLYLIVLSERILFKYVPLSQIVSHFNFSSNQYHWHSSNFIPFKTIIFYLFLTDINLTIRISNLVGNIIGFMPFGMMFPLLFNRYLNLKSISIATFCLSLTYEVLQLLFNFGSFDVDDLILNTFGGMIGFLVISLILTIVKFATKHEKDRSSMY